MRLCAPQFALVCVSRVLLRQYGEFRKGFRLASGHDEADKRIVTYGIRYVVENYLERRWTLADVEAAALFYRRAADSAPPVPQTLAVQAER